MNTTNETQLSHAEYIGTGGYVTEGAGAIATIILAIIGLCNVYPTIVAPVAAIIIGAVFLTDGALVSAASRRVNGQGASARRWLAGGVTAGFYSGVAGIVLGIIALFHSPSTAHTDEILIAVAVLVYGSALLISTGGFSRIGHTLGGQSQMTDASGGASAMGSGSVLVGVSAIVLGILAIIGLAPMILVLVGLLALGSGALFSGPTASGDMA